MVSFSNAHYCDGEMSVSFFVFAGRPNAGRWAGSRSPGSAGLQLDQWTTWVRGWPATVLPTCTLRQDFPSFSTMGYGPSHSGSKGVLFCFLVHTNSAFWAAGGKYGLGFVCRAVSTGFLAALARSSASSFGTSKGSSWLTATSPGRRGSQPKASSAGDAPKSGWYVVLRPKTVHGSMDIQSS